MESRGGLTPKEQCQTNKRHFFQYVVVRLIPVPYPLAKALCQNKMYIFFKEKKKYYTLIFKRVLYLRCRPINSTKRRRYFFFLVLFLSTWNIFDFRNTEVSYPGIPFIIQQNVFVVLKKKKDMEECGKSTTEKGRGGKRGWKGERGRQRRKGKTFSRENKKILWLFKSLWRIGGLDWCKKFIPFAACPAMCNPSSNGKFIYKNNINNIPQ